MPEEVDPESYSPGDGSTIEPAPNVNFEWSAAVDATGYDVWLEESGNPRVKIASNISATSFNYVSEFAEGTSWNWSVDARNANGVTQGILANFEVGGAP